MRATNTKSTWKKGRVIVPLSDEMNPKIKAAILKKESELRDSARKYQDADFFAYRILHGRMSTNKSRQYPSELWQGHR